MDEHRLERRAKLLSAGLQARREALRMALAAPGQRPPFSEQLARPAALSWWRKHRGDELGARVLANMRPDSILELDQALSRMIEGETPELLPTGDQYGA